MKKIHLDTDIGGDPDDVCALALLLKWRDVQVTGITTMTEDRGRRAGYAKYVLKLAVRDEIVVKVGADVSDEHYSYSAFRSGCHLDRSGEISPLTTCRRD